MSVRSTSKNPQFAQSIGSLIRAKRKKLKISETELGRRIGTNRSSVNSIERGVNNLSLERFLRLVPILGISIDEINEVQQ